MRERLRRLEHVLRMKYERLPLLAKQKDFAIETLPYVIPQMKHFTLKKRENIGNFPLDLCSLIVG